VGCTGDEGCNEKKRGPAASWRSGCAEEHALFSRAGVAAAGVTSSTATGALVEPARGHQCIGIRLLVVPLSAARLRAWRVAGVAI
jgi:hypothetical protein